MDSHDLPGLLESLLSLRREAEWVEFKLNKAIAREIGEYLSAVSNSAALHHKDHGYIVWGIEDQSLRVLGTTFRPRRTKVGNEELESWLSHQLEPRVHFVVHEFEYHGRPVVIFQVQACPNRPVGFRVWSTSVSEATRSRSRNIPRRSGFCGCAVRLSRSRKASLPPALPTTTSCRCSTT